MPIYFTRLNQHGADWLHSAALPPPLCRHPSRSTDLAIGTLNTRGGRGFRLAQAVRAVKLGDFDLMVLTESNIYTAAYCRHRLGYNIVCSPARPTSASREQGFMCLVSWDQPTGWILESTRFHMPNVVI